MNIPVFLDLLPPDQLLFSSNSETTLQPVLVQVLHLIWQALNETPSPQAICIIAQAELILSTSQHHNWSFNIANVTVPLKALDIQDYDQFFAVRRIQSDSPIEAIIASLTTAIHSFLDICLHKPEIEPILIDRQIEGFKNYVQLLARLFDVHLEEYL
jgi:hypothetical protein